MFWSFSMVLPVCRSLCEIDALDPFERAVIRDDHAIAGCEVLEHFELLGVAAAGLDRAAMGGLAILAQHEHPVSTGAFEECAGRQHERLAIFAERELALQRLPG